MKNPKLDWVLLFVPTNLAVFEMYIFFAEKFGFYLLYQRAGLTKLFFIYSSLPHFLLTYFYATVIVHLLLNLTFNDLDVRSHLKNPIFYIEAELGTWR